MHNLRKRKRKLLRAKRARVQRALQDTSANLTDPTLSRKDYHHLQSATNQYKQSAFVDYDNDFYDMYGSGGEHDWMLPQTSEHDSSDESSVSSSLDSSDKEFIKEISATKLDLNDYSTSTSTSTSTSISTSASTSNLSSASCSSNTESNPPLPPPNPPKRKPGRPRGSKNKVRKPKVKKLSSMFCIKCMSFFSLTIQYNVIINIWCYYIYFDVYGIFTIYTM